MNELGGKAEEVQVSRTAVLKRLLWKELREDWLVILIASLIPVLAFPAAASSGGSDSTFLLFIASLGSPFLVMMWATRKGSARRNEAKAPLAHLPVGLPARWCVSILAPWVVAALLGALFSAMAALYGASPAAQYGHVHVAVYLPAYRALWMTEGALYMAAGFASCYLLAETFSVWAAAIAGLVWAMAAVPIFAGGAGHGLSEVHLYVHVFARYLAASAAGLALYLWLSQTGRVKLGRVLSLVTMAAVMFGPHAVDAIIAARTPSPGSYAPINDSLDSLDRSIQVRPNTGPQGSASVKVTYCFYDRRTGQFERADFRQNVHTIALLSRDRVCLAQQLPGEETVRVIEWSFGRDTLSGRIITHGVRQVAGIPAGRNALDEAAAVSGAEKSSIGSASPDGRFLLVGLKSRAGDGADIWIVNLHSHESTIVLPNRPPGQWRSVLVSWMPGRVALSCEDSTAVVDLGTMRAVDLKLASESGGQR